MNVKTRLHEALHRVGLDLVPYDGRRFPARRRAEILDALGVELVADVGANEGQYANDRWGGGYRGSTARCGDAAT